MKQTLTVEEALALARRRHSAGALGDARSLYQLVVDNQPNNTDALTLLASVLYRLGAEQEAGELLDQAITLYANTCAQRPDANWFLAPLVNLLLARGRIAEAEARIEELEFPVLPVRATEEEFESRRLAAIETGRPPMLITTVPKSASESIWNRLAEGLQLGQCHLSLGLFPDCCLVPSRVRFAGAGGLVIKEHIPATAHNRRTLVEHGIDRVVVHLRDPRQALLSWVHFVRDDINHRLLAPIWRKIVPPRSALEQPLAGQIDWAIDHYLPHLIQFVRNWMEAEQQAEAPIRVLFSHFEQFRQEPEAYIDRVLAFYDVDREAFKQDAEAEIVHLRKGSIDEWREVFTPEQKERAWQSIPSDMAELHGWTA